MTGWGSGGRRRRLVAAALFLAVVSEVLTPPAHADPRPSLKLVNIADDESFVRNRKTKPVQLNLSTLVASVGGAFELRATRAPTYDGPTTFRQVDAHAPSTTFWDLDAAWMDGWFGIDDFFELKVTDASTSQEKHKTTHDWCPNAFSTERTSDEGPTAPTYPIGCSGHPFTLGTVWGVDAGWAGQVFDSALVAVPDGTYNATFSIAEPYRTEFGVAAEDAEVEWSFTVKTKRRKRRAGQASGPTSERATVRQEEQASHTAPPEIPPQDEWLPDLRATPAWSVEMDRRPDGRELIAFAATEWNAGPQPMVIEGFRENTSDELMTAYQYFYENGQPVGRDEVGTLRYEEHDDHDHWHFEQFVAYELVTPADQHVAPSTKAAWCLVPNAPIDMTVEGANWRPGNTDLSSACGHRRSLWIREVLDAGHGDTYFQFSDEAFDVTDVPDGQYRIKIEVNPDLVFHETDTANNVSYRDITLSTVNGVRQVEAAPVGDVFD